MPATIPLSKGFTPEKMRWPALASIKYDGVPVLFSYKRETGWEVRTRQNKAAGSCEHLFLPLVQYIARSPQTQELELVGEVLQAQDLYAPFKDTSGIVRRTSVQDGLVCKVFDGHYGNPEAKYFRRFQALSALINTVYANDEGRLPPVSPVGQTFVENSEKAEKLLAFELAREPRTEGLVVRDTRDVWSPNKRSWGYQKLLHEPTIDLRIVGFEEARSKEGEPLGMVGGLIASYHGEPIGIGPGKLTHDERRELWNSYVSALNSAHAQEAPVPFQRVAKIKYKKDTSYDKLRQPTFQHWHDKHDTDA